MIPSPAAEAVLSDIDPAGLGVTPDLLAGRALRRYEEARDLVPAEQAPNGRVHVLVAEAASAWQAMKAAAQADGVDIHILSGFRSIARQGELIRTRLDSGMTLEEVLTILAPPGFSEHHTGRAVDISTAGVRALQAEFEATAAYVWLAKHAASFGFTLSFPRDNPAGYQYEPWHWCHHGG